MPPTYFDRSQNLRIQGDVNLNLISNGEPLQDDPSFLQVTQRVQSANAQSRSIERGYKLLCDNTALPGLYGYNNTFTGPQCHPGTRLAVQDHIFKWLDDPDGEIAMWMNGPVGIGKSAIAQTVTHLAAERDQLCSAFFFFRSDDTRNSARHLVATLAYEMTQQMPRTLDPVCQTIVANPLIFSYSLDRQIKEILLQPHSRANGSSSERTRLMIIDGLDECLDTNTQQAIIQFFISNFLSVFIPPFPHKLLIVSRPESHIVSSFSFANICAHVKHLPLGLWKTEDDIGIYLRDKLKEIKDTHPIKHHLPDIWPDQDLFRELRRRAVGSFAYASSVIRFLSSHKQDPKRALQDILSLKPLQGAAAFTDLDALYQHILSSMDSDICFTVQKILCLHLYSGTRQISSIAEDLSQEQAVVEIALVHVSSLIQCDGQTIGLHHESFEEFLRDRERSKEYYVFSPTVASALAPLLSYRWLPPLNDKNQYGWLRTVSDKIRRAEIANDMDIYILRALLATRFPASMFSFGRGYQSEPIKVVCDFMVHLQKKDHNSPYELLYSEAFDVVCAWLRLHFNIVFQGVATLSDILDIISGDLPNFDEIMKPGDPVLKTFWQLLHRHRDPIGFLCRLLPDMDCLEVYCGIVESFLALPRQRRIRASQRMSHFLHDIGVLRLEWLSELYNLVLRRNDAMGPKLCRRLEQVVLNGRKALGVIPRQYMTSEHCIFRILYDAPFYLEGTDLLPIQVVNPGVRDVGTLTWAMFAKKTDNYIRQVHAKLDFPYISADVGALYRLPPAEFENWCWPTYINRASDYEDVVIE